MRTSRRLHIGLPSDLEACLVDYGRPRGLGLGPAIRTLLWQALEATTRSGPDSSLALAALTASEHAVLMVASILPEGERRMHELGQRAATAAEHRLALFSTEGEQ